MRIVCLTLAVLAGVFCGLSIADQNLDLAVLFGVICLTCLAGVRAARRTT